MLKPLWGSLSAQERQQLLQLLAERYRDESSDAMLAEQAAEGLPYPHLRQTLKRATCPVARGKNPCPRGYATSFAHHSRSGQLARVIGRLRVGESR